MTFNTAFDDLVQTINRTTVDSLYDHPDFIDPDDFGRGSSSARLRRSPRSSAHVSDKIQYASFDFLGQCSMCGSKTRHVHGKQGQGIFELEGFPGLYIHPKHFDDPLVVREVVDILTHDCLTHPENRLTCRSDSQCVQFSGVQNDIFMLESQEEASMTRLGDCDNHTPRRSLLALVRDIKKLDLYKGLPHKLRKLFVEMLPPETVMPSTVRFASSMDNEIHSSVGSDSADALINFSFGCDGILVVGPKNTGKGHAPRPAAICLRSGDMLVLSGPSSQVRHSLAKVIEGTSSAWENVWPCWQLRGEPGQLFHTSHPESHDSWKGCMKGRRVELWAHTTKA